MPKAKDCSQEYSETRINPPDVQVQVVVTG